LVFESTESGIQAALSGDMWTIGIGSEEDPIKQAHVVLSSLATASWRSLLHQLERLKHNHNEERQKDSSSKQND
jgi:beta-phosphoglucomutase-like phosphatase (HAD superfamily)